MSKACGRPQVGRGQGHVDACGQGEGINTIFLWMS